MRITSYGGITPHADSIWFETRNNWPCLVGYSFVKDRQVEQFIVKVAEAISIQK